MLTQRHVFWPAAMLAFMAATLAAQNNATSWTTVNALATGADVRVAIGTRTVHGKVLRVTNGLTGAGWERARRCFLSKRPSECYSEATATGEGIR